MKSVLEKNNEYTNTKYITFPWHSLKPQISVEGSHYTLMYVSWKAIFYFMWFKESYGNFFLLHKEVGKWTSWSHPPRAPSMVIECLPVLFSVRILSGFLMRMLFLSPL